MGMFDNYVNISTAWPDNKIKFLDVDIASEYDGDIMVGSATNVHIFNLPVAEAEIKDYLVSYKQGLSIILEKHFGDCTFVTIDGVVCLRCELTVEESRLFNDYNKDTFIQLTLTLQDDVVAQSNVYRLAVSDTINDESSEGSEG